MKPGKVIARAASTHPDLHGTIITKAALEGFAKHVNGPCPPYMGVEHDPTIPPMGKVLDAQVVAAEDGHYELLHTMEIFSTPTPVATLGGQQLLIQGSTSDRRPFAGSLPGSPKDVLSVRYDPINFLSQKERDFFLAECREEGPVEKKEMTQKSIIPEPTLYITLTTVVLKCLAAKKLLDKAVDKLLDPVFDDLSKIYPHVKKIVISYAQNIRSEQRVVNYIISAPGDPNVEFAAKTDNPTKLLESLISSKLRAAVGESEELKDAFNAVKVQYLLAEDGTWRLNYLLTATGETIGTPESFGRRDLRLKQIDLAQAQASIAGTIE
jgi:hypothetical protein